jgi:DNA-binding MarR family transcriptional regulator
MDQEARLAGTSVAEHPQELRLWLRLLTCTQLIEQSIRARLRSGFQTTLPRFDLMAQLERFPDGMKMNELSRRMMVTRGNITGITNQLVAEGLVERVEVDEDRRSWRVRLTPQGRQAFHALALAHEDWIVQSFAGLGKTDAIQLHKLLGRVKESLPAKSPQSSRTPRRQPTTTQTTP